jgi:hypothetical protein
MKIINSQDARQADAVLTATEVQLLRDFRKLTGDAQQFASGFMEKLSTAPTCQRAQPKPPLRVVKGGAA